MSRTSWTMRLWAAIVFVAALLEARGLLRKGRADTLSEYTWAKTNHPVMAGAVTGLVGWLVYHFSYGRGVPLGKWDLASAGLGVVIGYLSRAKRGPPHAP